MLQCYAEKNVFTHTLDVKNAISPCLCFCCMNNRIIFLRVRMNQSTKIGIFCRKRGVYELIGLVDDSTCMYYKWTFSVDVEMTLRIDSRIPCELECILLQHAQTKQWLPHSQALRCGQPTISLTVLSHWPLCTQLLQQSWYILNYTRLFAHTSYNYLYL